MDTVQKASALISGNLHVPSRSSGPQQMQLIQLFRGLAAVLVLLFHLGARSRDILGVEFAGSVFSPGWSGVDFFFVLSGFIIFFVHRSEFGGNGNVRLYALKRFVRIYPLYWLLSFAVLPIYFLGYGHGYKRDFIVLIKSVFLFPQDPGVFPVLNVAWTLSYEVLFYLVFALFLVLAPAVAGVLAFTVLSLTLVVQVGSALSLIEVDYLLGFLLSKYNFEFALGCLSAALLGRFSEKQGMMLLLFGTAVLAVNWWLSCTGLSSLDSVLAFGVPYFLIILGAASLERAKSIPIPRLLNTLGAATYSIYLSHFVLLSLQLTLIAKIGLVSLLNPAIVLPWVVLFTLAAGIAIHHFIEAPLLSYLRCRLAQLRLHDKRPDLGKQI